MLQALPIFSAEQIKLIDTYTIQSEPIASIDLMEGAASKCSQWIMKHYDVETVFKVCCGLGNNGGDGLAIARLLATRKYNVKTFILPSENYSKDCKTNLNNFKKQLKKNIKTIHIPIRHIFRKKLQFSSEKKE